MSEEGRWPPWLLVCCLQKNRFVSQMWCRSFSLLDLSVSLVCSCVCRVRSVPPISMVARPAVPKIWFSVLYPPVAWGMCRSVAITAPCWVSRSDLPVWASAAYLGFGPTSRAPVRIGSFFSQELLSCCSRFSFLCSELQHGYGCKIWCSDLCLILPIEISSPLQFVYSADFLHHSCSSWGGRFSWSLRRSSTGFSFWESDPGCCSVSQSLDSIMKASCAFGHGSSSFLRSQQGPAFDFSLLLSVFLVRPAAGSGVKFLQSKFSVFYFSRCPCEA
jgi:hypothetical protein